MAEKLVTILSPEIGWINDDGIRESVITLLMDAPDNFLTWAASSTGKYHPPDQICPEGMVIHVKRCVAIAPDIARLFNFNPYEEDILIGACIVHDLYKRGRNSDSAHTEKEHPLAVYEKIMKLVPGSHEYKGHLANACLFHEGKWTIPEAYKFSGGKAGVYAEAMHVVDMVVSRRMMYTIMQPEWTAKVLEAMKSE